MYTTSDKIEFIQRVFGRVDHYNDGNLQVKCPNINCSSRKKRGKRKLAINIFKYDVFQCWSCGYRGTLIKALKEYCSKELIQEYIKRFCDEKAILDYEEQTIKPVTLPDDFILLASQTDSKSLAVKRALKYLRGRGISNRDLWYFKFGIANSLWDRVIMPSFDRNGNLNYWAARTIRNEDWVLSYILPKFPKKGIIFNEINIDWTKELTITEGPFDLVKCDENSTILNGSNLSEDSLLFMKIIQNETPVLLAIDPDMKYTKLIKQVKLLSSYGIKTRILSHGPFSDVGEMSKKDFMEMKHKAIEWDKYDILRHKARSLQIHKF